MYNIYVKDIANNKIYELPFSSITLTHELNKGANANFSFEFSAIEEIANKYNTTPLFILTAGRREIWVEKNGTKIYTGYISDYSINLNEQGVVGIQVASVDVLALLAKRRTGAKRVFSSTDAGDIAWTLIDESQTSDNPYSDLGITEGSITASINRSRTFRFAEVKQEIWQMSRENLVNGFDFEINALKQFNVFYPQKGSNRANLVMDAQNIINWSFKKPLLMSLCNRVHVLGNGFNDDRVYVTRTADSSYRNTFGLLEDIQSEPDTKETANLSDKGDGYLALNQAPRVELVISHIDGDPDILNYETGDNLPVTIPELDYDADYLRVYKRQVSIDSNEKAIATITLR